MLWRSANDKAAFWTTSGCLSESATTSGPTVFLSALNPSAPAAIARLRGGPDALCAMLAGLSWSPGALLAARALQGLGAALLAPAALAIIMATFPQGPERNRALGIWGAVGGLGGSAGLLLGGVLTDTIGWPFVFFLNVPVGLVVLFTVRRYLPAYHPAGDRPRIDYLGAALFTGALVPILVGLTNKQSADWTDASVGGLILLGLAVLAAFVFVESRASEPIVPLNLFRNRAFTVSVGSVFLAASGFFAAVVFLPRWFQVVNGSSATISGYQMLPLLGGVILTAVAAGQIVARTGRYRWLVFFVLWGGLDPRCNRFSDCSCCEVLPSKEERRGASPRSRWRTHERPIAGTGPCRWRVRARATGPSAAEPRSTRLLRSVLLDRPCLTRVA